MDELYRQLPAVIEQAAKSPLGLLALMVVALAGLGLVFFKAASERTRVAIFVLLLTGVAAFGWAVMRVGPGESGASQNAADVTGTWTATVLYDFGDEYEEQFSFERHGNALVGSASFVGTSWPIQDAEVAGDTLTFVTRTSEIFDQEIRERTHRYVGVVDGEDAIAFVMQTEGSQSAKFVATRKNP